jgi:hypothetical protein
MTVITVTVISFTPVKYDTDFLFHIHFSVVICDFLVISSYITIVPIHVPFRIHYRNNLIDKKNSYLIPRPPSWDDHNYSYGHDSNIWTYHKEITNYDWKMYMKEKIWFKKIAKMTVTENWDDRNCTESDNYLTISRSSSASKSVEIFWAEIYRGRLFLGPNLVSFNRTVVPYEISKVNFRVETKIIVSMSEEN